MKGITRKDKREKEKNINFFEEFIEIQKHFFKDEASIQAKKQVSPTSHMYIRGQFICL